MACVRDRSRTHVLLVNQAVNLKESESTRRTFLVVLAEIATRENKKDWGYAKLMCWYSRVNKLGTILGSCAQWRLTTPIIG